MAVYLQNELYPWGELLLVEAGDGAPHELDLWMVAQVLAHSGRVADYRHPDISEVSGWADAGQHQQMWRANGAGGQDYLVSEDGADFAVNLHIDADGPVAIEHHPVGEGVGQYREIGPVAGRVEVAQCSAPAYPVGVVERTGADSGGVGVVVVRAVCEAVVSARLVPGCLVGKHVFRRVPSNDDRPIAAVEVV